MKICENAPCIELEIDEIFESSGGGAGGGGDNNYENLKNKPSINGVKLIGDVSLEELGLAEISNSEIEDIIKSIGGL